MPLSAPFMEAIKGSIITQVHEHILPIVAQTRTEMEHIAKSRDTELYEKLKDKLDQSLKMSELISTWIESNPDGAHQALAAATAGRAGCVPVVRPCIFTLYLTKKDFHPPEWKNSRLSLSFKNMEIKRRPCRYDYRYFEIKLSMFDISVSLWRWLDGNGKGLGKDAVVRGVRGVIDRRSLQWSPGLDPASFHHVSQQVDFEVESLALEDVLITIYLFQFPCGCWLCHPSSGLFYDFKFSKAEGVVGQFDNSLDIKFSRDADADSLNILIDALATTAVQVAVVTDRIHGVSESLPSHLYPRLKGIMAKQSTKKMGQLCYIM
ncbi:mitochondrial distribution and morphology proteins-domain-containing protein [Russula aff. rugulosa BPL654]|nr:mitochondrial distribution and morphology proteins-domain-containing protein [Russula aff. rugulosa BPL654]